MRGADRGSLSTRLRANTDRFGVALLLVVATIIITAFAGNSAWGRFLAVVFEGGTLLFILDASDAGRKVFRATAVLVILSLMLTFGAALIGGKTSNALPVIIGALLALAAPVAIVRRLARHERITAHTVFGALCLYLLAGLFFAFLYSAIGALHEGFFTQTNNANSLDFVYFSFVTLATVGYGDLTSNIDAGRMLAVTEALLGQLYLVSVVALLVSNLGRVRQPSMRRGGGGQPVPEEPPSSPPGPTITPSG